MNVFVVFPVFLEDDFPNIWSCEFIATNLSVSSGGKFLNIISVIKMHRITQDGMSGLKEDKKSSYFIRAEG